MDIRCITVDIDGETRAMIDVYRHFIAETRWNISFEEFIDLHDGWMEFTIKPEDYPYMYKHADLIMNKKVSFIDNIEDMQVKDFIVNIGNYEILALPDL